MEAHTAQRRMREGAGNRSDDAEAQSLVEFDGGAIRFDHGVELHSGVAAFAGPVQREPAQRGAHAARLEAAAFSGSDTVSPRTLMLQTLKRT